LRDLEQQSIWQIEAQMQHLQEEFDLELARPSTTELVGAPDAENLQAEACPSLVQPMIMAAPAADLLVLDEFNDALQYQTEEIGLALGLRAAVVRLSNLTPIPDTPTPGPGVPCARIGNPNNHLLTLPLIGTDIK
jgi:hypothetical protein